MNQLLLFAVAVVGIGAYLGTQMANETAMGVESTPGAAVAAAPAAAQAGRVVALRGDSRGHFVTDVQANGRFLKVLVDTGASLVALPAAEARKAGLEPAPSAYTLRMQTANGIVRGAPVRIHELRIGPILVRDVEAVVLPDGALGTPLLGMSFLKRLASFEMRGGSLVLTQ